MMGGGSAPRGWPVDTRTRVNTAANSEGGAAWQVAAWLYNLCVKGLRKPNTQRVGSA
jgi:hypothetical protein